MRHTTVDVSAAKPDEGSLELTEGLIRVHAYRFMTRLKVFARLIKTTTATDKLKFVSGTVRTLFPKSPSRNIESKECSQQETGTTQQSDLSHSRGEEDQRHLKAS